MIDVVSVRHNFSIHTIVVYLCINFPSYCCIWLLEFYHCDQCLPFQQSLYISTTDLLIINNGLRSLTNYGYIIINARNVHLSVPMLRHKSSVNLANSNTALVLCLRKSLIPEAQISIQVFVAHKWDKGWLVPTHDELFKSSHSLGSLLPGLNDLYSHHH